MPEFFIDRLRSAGIDTSKVKLLRHDDRGLEAWLQSRDHFLSFTSVQSAQNSPFKRNPQFVAHFLSGPRLTSGGHSALFVGISRLHARWPWDERRPPRVWLADYRTPGEDEEAADQSWEGYLADAVERLEVDWGDSPRTWHQWPRDGSKPINREGHLVDLHQWANFMGVDGGLSEKEKYRATIESEERDLNEALTRNPTAIERAFDEFRSSVVRVRPNQKLFRDELAQRYGLKCAITGCDVPDALEACHITPFAEGSAERDLPSNGLILRRDVHRLFDLQLISVDPEDRMVWVHPKLRDSDYQKLADKILEADPARSALAEHFRRSCQPPKS